MAPKSSSALHARPYALPSVNQLPPEDNWTGIKDPKEKKKLQNRVAQRLYRHRMKERIKILQDRLEYQEIRRRETLAPMANNSVLPITASGAMAPSLVYQSTEMMPAVDLNQPLSHCCPASGMINPELCEMLPHHIGQDAYQTPMIFDDGSFFRSGSNGCLLASGVLVCPISGIYGGSESYERQPAAAQPRVRVDNDNSVLKNDGWPSKEEIERAPSA